MITYKTFLFIGTSLLGVSLLSSCASIPENAKAIEGFEPHRYMGRWYEIARFDYRFEKGLNNVTAQYSFLDSSTVSVLNSGYDYIHQRWKSATGKAKFREDKNKAALKVSFFGPFYSGYNVIALDNNYQYALIAGKSLDYLWILSRTKSIPDDVKQDYLKKAEEIGYDTTKLVWVEHNQDNPAHQ